MISGYEVFVRPYSRPGVRALFQAIAAKDVKEVIKQLSYRINLHEIDESGITSLIWAVIHDQLEIVKILLAANAAVIDQADADGRTPLCWAIILRRHDIVGELLSKGADICREGRGLWRVIDWAAFLE